MPTAPLSEVQLMVFALLVFASGSIVSGVQGVPFIGAFAALVVGAGYLLIGRKYWYFSLSPLDNLGKTLVTAAVLLTGASLVLTAFGVRLFDPVWANVAAGFGVILGVAANKL